MLVIGLTGGIGSGKTTVGEILQSLGAAYLNADLLGHHMLKSPSSLLDKLVQVFDIEYILPSGELDRKKLADLVFRDKKALKHLNRIMHPAMLGVVKQNIRTWKKKGFKIGVVEAAALIEAKWDKAMDEVWVTVAPRELIIERLRRNKSISRDEVIARMNSQISNSERRRKASVVINTGCPMSELRENVAGLFEEALSRSMAKKRAP